MENRPSSGNKVPQSSKSAAYKNYAAQRANKLISNFVIDAAFLRKSVAK